MARWLAVFTTILFLSSCTDSYQIIPQSQQTVSIDPSESIVIAQPKAGRYNAQTTYSRSGSQTAKAIYDAFIRHTHAVTRQMMPMSEMDSIQAARRQQAFYLVYTRIYNWEDHVTEWNAQADRVDMKIDIIDATSGQVVTSTQIKGKSGIATLGGDHPQDLLPEPINKFVDSLYQ